MYSRLFIMQGNNVFFSIRSYSIVRKVKLSNYKKTTEVHCRISIMKCAIRNIYNKAEYVIKVSDVIDNWYWKKMADIVSHFWDNTNCILVMILDISIAEDNEYRNMWKGQICQTRKRWLTKDFTSPGMEINMALRSAFGNGPESLVNSCQECDVSNPTSYWIELNYAFKQ